MNAYALKELGSHSVYMDEYNPGLLEKVSRAPARAAFRLDTSRGYDLWRLYELTYLNRLAIPEVAMGMLTVPASSPFIVESKSLKLYLGSFTQTRFENLSEVAEVITHDLGQLLECDVKVSLWDVEDAAEAFAIAPSDATLIDVNAGFVIDSYDLNPELLIKKDGPRVEETLRSNLLRTLCPVTSQPDHASVLIHYQGVQVNHLDLLRYLISFRQHQGFHEQCVEQIYHDLKFRLKLDKVSVKAFFTRRGGIDINPVRSDFDETHPALPRTLRQ